VPKPVDFEPTAFAPIPVGVQLHHVLRPSQPIEVCQSYRDVGRQPCVSFRETDQSPDSAAALTPAQFG